MARSASNTSRWMIPVAALVAATGLLWLYRDFRTQVASNRQIILERGAAVLESLAAGVRAQTRMGRYRPDRLADIFSELAQTPGIVGVRLDDAAGNTVASGGHTAFPNLAPESPPLWQGKWLIMARAVSFEAHGPGMGQGGFGRGRMADEGSVPWGGDRYVLAIALDAAWLDSARVHEQRQFALAAAVWLGSVALFVTVLRARGRQRRLETDLLVAEERARRQEDLAHMGAGLAHETKNPLGIVRGLAQAIHDVPDLPAGAKRMARDIVDEADRTVGQINLFLDVARPKPAELKPVDVDALIGDLLPLLQGDAQSASVRFVHEKAGIRILADPDLLRRALMNLAINSVRACGNGGTVHVATHRRDKAIVLEVSDTGCGIAAEDLVHVTEPYFSRFTGGTGLGLAIVDQIAHAHGWTLHIESAPGKGTRVSLDGVYAVG